MKQKFYLGLERFQYCTPVLISMICYGIKLVLTPSPSCTKFLLKNQNYFTNLKRLAKKIHLRTFESIAKEHIICADKLVLVPNVYYSLATVCYVVTKSFNL